MSGEWKLHQGQQGRVFRLSNHVHISETQKIQPLWSLEFTTKVRKWLIPSKLKFFEIWNSYIMLKSSNFVLSKYVNDRDGAPLVNEYQNCFIVKCTGSLFSESPFSLPYQREIWRKIHWNGEQGDFIKIINPYINLLSYYSCLGLYFRFVCLV